MYDLGMVRIGGGQGGRPSLFSAPMSEQFRGGPAMGGIFDFYSDQQYYQMAKAAVASFDQLAQRVNRIADKAVRDQIIKDYGMSDARPGDVTLNNASLSQRNQVQSWIDKADAAGDPGYGFADDGAHGRHRVDRLASLDADISSEVQDAELKYGILPAPAVQVNQTQAPAGSSWTVPIIVGVGAIAAAAILGVFGGK